MNKEELDRLLAAGEITQDEYNAKLAEFEAEQQGQKSQEMQIETLLQSDAVKAAIAAQIQAASQAEADRVRTEYAKKLKAKDAELEAERIAKMTGEERAKAELEQERKALEDERAELHRIKIESAATTALAETKLPLELKQFVVGENEQDVKNRANALASFLKKEIQAGIDQGLEAEFAKHGYKPGGSQQQSSAEKNPWSKEQFNLTEQGRLYRENPEKARQMAAQYGYKL
ncbi:DUF4355 domain-containing protein [Solibacillus isronensis]|uniref:capsid assembly scaffolding protein Gp46 family protein n=1 Tax=Solibacillus isronensis TaxID=412383 RepID=UPI0039A243B1